MNRDKMLRQRILKMESQHEEQAIGHIWQEVKYKK